MKKLLVASLALCFSLSAFEDSKSGLLLDIPGRFELVPGQFPSYKNSEDFYYFTDRGNSVGNMVVFVKEIKEPKTVEEFAKSYNPSLNLKEATYLQVGENRILRVEFLDQTTQHYSVGYFTIHGQYGIAIAGTEYFNQIDEQKELKELFDKIALSLKFKG